MLNFIIAIYIFLDDAIMALRHYGTYFVFQVLEGRTNDFSKGHKVKRSRSFVIGFIFHLNIE